MFQNNIISVCVYWNKQFHPRHPPDLADFMPQRRPALIIIIITFFVCLF